MMSDEEMRTLGHARILEFHKFYSEFQFWIAAGNERFRVTIRIYETNDGRFFFVQSHFIKTPMQDAPFSTTNLTHLTPHLALGTAVESITAYYDGAVGAGHEPSIDWFFANDQF